MQKAAGLSLLSTKQYSHTTMLPRPWTAAYSELEDEGDGAPELHTEGAGMHSTHGSKEVSDPFSGAISKEDAVSHTEHTMQARGHETPQRLLDRPQRPCPRHALHGTTLPRGSTPATAAAHGECSARSEPQSTACQRAGTSGPQSRASSRESPFEPREDPPGARGIS